MRMLMSLILTTVIGSAPAAEIYISPTGDDGNPGTEAKPLATLERARDAIRARAKGERGDGVTVWLQEGRYVRDRTFELDKRDSGTKDAPVVYRAVPGAKVIIDGGIEIPLKACVPVTDPQVKRRLVAETADKVRMIDLKALGVTRFGEFGPRGFDRPLIPPPNELFVNGKPQHPARWPNKGRIKLGKVLDKGSVPRKGDKSNRGGVFKYENKRALRWTEAKDFYVSGIFGHSWADDTIKVAKLDTTDGTITTTVPHLYGFMNKGYTTWCVVNLLDEIDEPGEFFLDREAGRVYFYPSEDEIKQLQLSIMETPLVRIDGASYLRIEGLTFENARGTGIEVKDGSDVVIAGCTLRNLGSLAIAVNGGMRHVVRRCDIYDTGAGGVALEGGDRKTLTPARHLVENCDIHQVNRWYRTYRPCVSLKGVGHAVRHNHLHHVPGQAILFFDSNDHLIEFNEIDHCVTDMSDMGAVYTGRNPSILGHVIRYNFFHHIDKSIGGKGVQAIYIDDDNLYTAVIFGNVFYKAGSNGAIKFNGGGGASIANNIFVDCPRPLLGGDEWGVNRAMDRMRNPGWEHRTYQKITEEVDVREEPYKSRYPYLLDTFQNGFNYGTPFWNNYVVKGQYDSFTDVKKLDFSLRPESPALSLVTNDVTDRVYGVNGQTIKFQPIPFDRIGLAREAGLEPTPIEPADYFPPAFGGKARGSQ